MKILFYSPVKLVNGGGCERWHCDITNSLKNQYGHEVKIITANLGDQKWEGKYVQTQLNGIKYEIVPQLIVAGNLIPTFKAWKKMYQEFNSADIVHFIHGFAGQDIFVLLLKLFTGKKIVVGHHAPILHKSIFHNVYMNVCSRFLLKFFDGHQTLNSKDKKFLETKWKIRNVNFIPSGIRVEKFLKVKRSKHDSLNFLSVGRYEGQKGFELLIEAIRQFNQAIPENRAQFHFVGGGLLKDMITQAAKSHPNIIDHGYIQYEEIPSLYQDSDIYLLSSREEPFGLVLIEAWAAGIPVLATKTEGPLDMVKNNKNGWFINQINTDSMYESIAKLYEQWENDKLVFSRMEQACRNTGKEYSIDVTAQKMHSQLFSPLFESI